MRNRVREGRRQLTIYQAKPGSEPDFSRQTVIAIESGRYSPSVPLAFKTARFFGTTVDSMFDPEEEKVPE